MELSIRGKLCDVLDWENHKDDVIIGIKYSEIDDVVRTEETFTIYYEDEGLIEVNE